MEKTTVYGELKETGIKWTMTKPVKAYSTRTFKSAKSYAKFYFENNNALSELKEPEYNLFKDLLIK